MSDEWKISPIVGGGYRMSNVTNPLDVVLILSGKPEDMQIRMVGQPIKNLYEWNLIWQRMSTLIEAARTDQRIQSGVPPIDYEAEPTDTLCHACQKPPPQYLGWGFPCITTDGCRGHYYPRSFVEERFGHASPH
jgi:hypothetical protein